MLININNLLLFLRKAKLRVINYYSVAKSAEIGVNTKIWDYSQVRENVNIGKNCSIGRNVYIGPGVSIGNQVKIQNNVLIYEPAVIEDGVFIGPGVVFTNDLNPRAINVDGTSKTERDWQKTGVEVRYAASIGAGSICVAPVVIDEWAMVAAGSIVTKDVARFSLVSGVPAKRVGWVGKAGIKLVEIQSNLFECPVTGNRYKLVEGIIEEVV
jgi:UDP-2-acetamido-3-amino-2,3-dideoxy-glucuronate N-acetyltransferase